MALSELVFSRKTLLLIKDWDGFQRALRTSLRAGKGRAGSRGPSPTPVKKRLAAARVCSWLVILFLALHCGSFGAQAAPASKSGNKAVVLAVFGTSHESALPAILNIREKMRDSLPEYVPLKLAFTSSIIRDIWQERRRDPDYINQHPEVPAFVLNVKGTLASIAEFQDQGYDYIAVQPTHFTSGEEFADLSSYVAGLNSIRTIKKRNMPFQKILLGRPALGTPGLAHEYKHDIERVARALAPDAELAAKERRTLVYMAHGNEHYALGGVYLEFEQAMARLYPQVETYITTVEGFPGSDYLLERLSAAHISKVLVKPFMIVAGDHAKNDMAGEGAGSLKSILENQGYDVLLQLEGLGKNDAFAAIFAQHLRDAVHNAGLRF